MKILLATDGSKYSDAAAQKAATWLHAQDAEAVVLRVVEPLVFSVPPQMAPGYAPETAARLEERLKDARDGASRTAELLKKAGFKAGCRIVQSETGTGILEVAREWQPDVIVLGSHGEKGLKRFLLGSVAEHVARHAQCSVLVVRDA